MSQFAVVAGGAVAVFLLWMGLTDAYGAPVVIAVAIATATFAAGLWFVVPEAFEIDEVRSATAEVLAIGILLALAQRVLFDLVRLGASPYHSYPLWQWTIAALGPLLVFVVLVGSLVREREQTRIRRVMTLFGGAGLAYAVVASATYVLDIGFTAGRWGLVPVWAVLGIYPILSVPIHVFGAGILGWGWASGRNQLIGAVVGVTVATGLFHFATVRSPFWGPLIVVAFGATWMWLFAKHPRTLRWSPESRTTCSTRQTGSGEVTPSAWSRGGDLNPGPAHYE